MTNGGRPIYQGPRAPHNPGVRHTELSPAGHKAGGGLGGKKGGGGGKKGGVGKFFGGMGKYPGIRTGPARRLVNTQTRALMQQLRSQNKLNRINAATDLKNQQGQYQAGVGDMNYVHGQVGGYLHHMDDRMNALYNQGKTGAQANTAQFINQLQAGGDAQEQAYQAEQARLGLQSSTAQGEFDQNTQFATNQARQAGADRLSNMNYSQQSADMINELMQGSNKGSQAQILGQLLNTRNQGINDIKANSRESRQKILDAMQQTRLQQSANLQQMLMTMAQQGYGMWAGQQGGGGGGGGYGYSPYGSGGGGSDYSKGDPSYAEDAINRMIQGATSHYDAENMVAGQSHAYENSLPPALMDRFNEAYLPHQEHPHRARRYVRRVLNRKMK